MDSLAVETGVQTLDRAVAVLGAVAESGPLALVELVEATGLTRPTAHRLARALEQHSLLGRDTEGRFRLGPRLVELGAHRLRRHEPEPPMSKGFIVMQDPEGNEFCLD